jgi:N4-gp56 family major capsid protein
MTEDQLTRDMLAATASIYNCTSGQNGDVPTNITIADCDTVTSGLLGNDAWMILDRIEGENRFGTGPTRDAYIAMTHTRMTKDLNALDGFIPKWNYPLIECRSDGGIQIFTNQTRTSYLCFS